MHVDQHTNDDNRTPARLTRTGTRLRLFGLLAVCVTLVVASAASARVAGGGGNIASAPTIALNQTIEGNLGVFNNNFDGYQGEYFKADFQAGDRVRIQVISAGTMAPCAAVYLPGTDDYNFSYDGGDLAPNQDWNVNTNHFQNKFIAGTTGTYVIAMNNLFDDCYSDAANWAYSFVVSAPHGLRLSLPKGYLVRGTNHLSVSVRNALDERFSDGSLLVKLTVQWPGYAPRTVGTSPVRDGVAKFHLSAPRTLVGAVAKIRATAGDNVTWTYVSARHSYKVH
jgi:hypothetical protein